MLPEDLGLNDEQRLLRDTVRAFARDRRWRRARRRLTGTPPIRTTCSPRCAISASSRVPFPERYGGADSVLSGCLAIEELGRVSATTPPICCWCSGHPLRRCWRAVRRRSMSAGCRASPDGGLKAAISVTEPQSGSDAAGIRTRAVREQRRLPPRRGQGLVHQQPGSRFHCRRGKDRSFGEAPRHFRVRGREGDAGPHRRRNRSASSARAASPPARSSSTAPSCRRRTASGRRVRGG